MFNIVYNLIKINHKASEPVERFGNIFLMHFWNEKERSRGLMSYVKNMCVNVSQELPKDHYGTSWGCKSSGINFRFTKVFFIGLWISVRGFVDPLSFLTSHVQSAVSSCVIYVNAWCIFFMKMANLRLWSISCSTKRHELIFYITGFTVFTKLKKIERAISQLETALSRK